MQIRQIKRRMLARYWFDYLCPTLAVAYWRPHPTARKFYKHWPFPGRGSKQENAPWQS